MKKLVALSIVFMFFTGYNYKIFAQKLEASSITPLAKTSLKAKKSAVGFDSESNTYQAVYLSSGSKGKTIVDTYNYDSNLKLIDQKSEELIEETANVKIINAKKKKDTNYKPKKLSSSFIKVIAGGGVLNTKLEQGTFNATEIWNDNGFYVWDVSYSEGKEIKLKSDDRRISTEFSMADEPEDFLKPGIWKWDVASSGREFKNHAAKTIITVMGCVSPGAQKTKGTKTVDYQTYSLQTYSISGSLSLLKEHTFSFKGPKEIAQKFVFPDGTVGVVFAPRNRVSQLGFDASILHKPNEYTYMHFGIDGSTIDSIDFICPVNAFKPNFFEMKEGSLYLLGTGSNINPEKYYWEIHHKPDNWVIMKITNGKLDYITANPYSEITSKNIMPASQKKGVEWEVGSTINKGQLIINSTDGSTYLMGKAGKSNDCLLLHFDNKGKLATQYSISNISLGTEMQLLNNPDGKTKIWMLVETEKEDKDTHKKFNYVRMASVNPDSRTISEISVFGLKSKEQKQDFYLLDITPMIIHDKYVVLAGEDEGKKNLWLAKIALQEK